MRPCLPLRLATLLLVGFCAVSVDAAPGDLDPSFGTNGTVVTDFAGQPDGAIAVALQPDNKIVLAGYSYANSDLSAEDFAVRAERG